MAYYPKSLKKYIPDKTELSAGDLHNIEKRLSRLENLSVTAPLELYSNPNSINIALNQSGPSVAQFVAAGNDELVPAGTTETIVFSIDDPTGPPGYIGAVSHNATVTLDTATGIFTIKKGTYLCSYGIQIYPDRGGVAPGTPGSFTLRLITDFNGANTLMPPSEITSHDWNDGIVDEVNATRTFIMSSQSDTDTGFMEISAVTEDLKFKQATTGAVDIAYIMFVRLGSFILSDG